MKIRVALFSIGVVLLAVLLGVSGCSKKKADELPHYEGWQTYSYKHFVFHYPADCYWGRKMDDFSGAYERYLTEDCDYLAIEIPKDTIHFYIHNNPEEGKKETGRDLPYFTENQIHWERQTPFGLELARYLINKMDIRMTDYRFLYDGLATLLDYSGADHHHNTYSLIDLKFYIPLDSLINNESYARQDSIYRGWEGASLVGFITYNFGINRFKMLWQSTASFDKSVKELFGMDLKTFEDNWLNFAKRSYKGVQWKEVPLDSAARK
jgi:hypothetical protein